LQIPASALPERLPSDFAERCVEALRAMVMEDAKVDADKTGVKLLQTLQSVTKD